MIGKSLTTSVIAAIFIFAWMMVSWTVLPWHQPTLNQFSDGNSVAAVIKANTPKSGIYVLSSHMKGSDTRNNTETQTNNFNDQVSVDHEMNQTTDAATSASGDQMESHTAATNKATQPVQQDAQQPLIFASVDLQGSGSMAKNMILCFFSSLLAAFLVCLLLSHTQGLGYSCRLIFVMVFALAASVIANAPYWTWWHFATDYTLISIADTLVGWFFAGIVIAAMIKGKNA